MKIVKKSDQNQFSTNKRLVIAGRRCKAAVVSDIKLFRPRKQGNGNIQTCGDFRSREIRNGEIASRSSWKMTLNLTLTSKTSFC